MHKRKAAIIFAVSAAAFVAAVFWFARSTNAAPVTLRPNAAGANTGWTGNFGNVDDDPADDDTTTDSTTVPNAIQTYNLPNLTRQGKIYSVKVYARAKADASPETIKLVVRTSATNYFSTNQTVTGLWANYSYEWTSKPTGGDWAVTDIDNLEIGYQFSGSGSGTHRVTQLWAEITYKTELKKLVWHIVQKTGNLVGSATSNDVFSIYVADEVDEVKSAFVEIKGVYTSSAQANLDVSVDDASYSSGRQRSFAMSASSIPRPFKILYDATSYLGTISLPGTYSWTMNVRVNTNMTVSVLSEKLILVYTHLVPPSAATGAYRAAGTLTSSTFDTSIASGAMYNSLIWQGTLPANTKVRLQLATANCSNGNTNPPACNNGADWQYYGDANGDGTCGTAEYYDVAANTPAEITCRATHNNQRYFRYKVQACSSTDCSTSGAATPSVTNVTVNWSP